MDLPFMKELALEAGEIGLKHFGRVTKHYKKDRSIVTAADIEIEDRLAFRCPAAIGNPLAVAAVPERVEGRIIDIPPASLRFRPAGE